MAVEAEACGGVACGAALRVGARLTCVEHDVAWWVRRAGSYGALVAVEAFFVFVAVHAQVGVGAREDAVSLEEVDAVARRRLFSVAACVEAVGVFRGGRLRDAVFSWVDGGEVSKGVEARLNDAPHVFAVGLLCALGLCAARS